MKTQPIFIFIFCALLSGCICPGVSAEYVAKSAALSSNVRSFEAENKRKPATRRELESFERERQVEPVTPWFTAVRFDHNEAGEFQVHSRKGWFIWEQGSGTSTFPNAIR